MSFRWLVIGLLVLLVPAVAQAQTATPTPTPTATAQPTSTPDNRGLLPVGALQPYAGAVVPNGWLLCDGSAVSRTSYNRLFAVLGTTWGAGNGTTTFNLPDFRGRAIVGAGWSPGITPRNLATPFGRDTHTLTVEQLPPHDHQEFLNTSFPLYAWVAAGTTGRFAPNTSQTTGTQIIRTGSTGAGHSFDIVQPSNAANIIIWAGIETLYWGSGGTPMPTPSPAPEIMVYSTVAIDGVSLPVAFRYEVTAGDFILTVALFFAVGIFLVDMLLRQRGKPSS